MLPSNLYPGNKFRLPQVITHVEIQQLFACCVDVRQQAVISLLYGCGLRCGEVQRLVHTDIERCNKRILIRQGKGNKDRYVLLPAMVLKSLENYYHQYKPVRYMFETPTRPCYPLHQRSIQSIVNAAMASAGFMAGKYTSHTLRHSYATLALDMGCDIHSIKTMILPIDEFARRFEQHILPFRFTKIRHYGYLKNYRRTERIAKIFADLRLPKPPPKVRIPIKQRMLEKKGVDITICPVCNKGTLEQGATYYHGVLSTTEPKRTVVYSTPP